MTDMGYGRYRLHYDSPTLGVQVADRRDVFKKYADNTWVVSIERLLSVLD